VKVVAPSDGVFHGKRIIEGIETVRFGYFWPRSLERLTIGAGGIPENVSKSFLAKIQIVPMIAVFVLVALRNAPGCDVLYANWLGAGIVGAVVNLLTGIPLIVSFRGDDGYLARDRFFWRLFTRWVASRAAIVAPVSVELLEIMRDLGIADSKLRLPRFGVDMDMFRPPETWHDQGTETDVLFVGALIPKKGLQCLLEALQDPSLERVRLTVVGDGYHADELKALCEKLGLKDRTRWMGILPPHEVARVMRESDLLCLPSFTEGSPNVVKEAMSSGLPVIASSVGGVPDLISDGLTGLLFEAGNVVELRRCIRTLCEDKALRREMGSAGHRFMKESGMNWDTTAQDFEKLFEDIMPPKSTNRVSG